MQGCLNSNALRAGLIAGVIATVMLLLSLIPLAGICLFLVSWIIYPLAGVLAAAWGKAPGTRSTLGQGALDGAIAGGISSAMALIILLFAQVLITFVAGFVITPEQGTLETGIATVLTMTVLGLLTTVAGVAVAIVLGGIGGLLASAVRQPPTASPGAS